MATVAEVATRVLAATDTGADHPIAITQVGRWVSDRYAQLVSRVRFRHRRRLGTFDWPATLVTGTVSVTHGSAVVTLDATAQAAVAAVTGFSAPKRWFRAATVWYPVLTYVAPTLTLATPYTEVTNATSGYALVQRYVELAADARWLGRFVHMRRRRELAMRALTDLDFAIPERTLIAEGPWYVSEAYTASSGAKQVELYPFSQQDETIHYTYWPLPAALALDDDIPQEIDAYVLREGALIDAFRFRAAQVANKGDVNAAGFWRNESRAQETVWERHIQDACRTDRGMDDISFICHVLGLSTRGGIRDIATGRDEVFARGLRP